MVVTNARFVPRCSKGPTIHQLQYEGNPATAPLVEAGGAAVLSEVTVLPHPLGTVHICVTEAGLLECCMERGKDSSVEGEWKSHITAASHW